MSPPIKLAPALRVSPLFDSSLTTRRLGEVTSYLMSKLNQLLINAKTDQLSGLFPILQLLTIYCRNVPELLLIYTSPTFQILMNINSRKLLNKMTSINLLCNFLYGLFSLNICYINDQKCFSSFNIHFLIISLEKLLEK